MSAALVREIVEANSYLTLATADAAGVPWASPVWFAHEGCVDFVWVSKPAARHSANVAARPEVGIVVFDSTVAPAHAQAVYVEAVARQAGADEVERLVAVFSARSVARGLPAWRPADVTGDARHRLFVARATAHFVLDAHDERVPVRLG